MGLGVRAKMPRCLGTLHVRDFEVSVGRVSDRLQAPVEGFLQVADLSLTLTLNPVYNLKRQQMAGNPAQEVRDVQCWVHNGV